jgi:alkanesulfonate monooxygenase SsuD/methylene tetrahydromethanopterin reductase-like flavin-dependent oxidoreductase (luciferase family)
VLAAAAASAQAISGGRLILGLGAGASPSSPWAAEQHALGIELRAGLAERHATLVSALDLMDELWGTDRDERYEGFARAEPRPPELIGVNSVALATIAGRRADGVNVRWNHPDLAHLLEVARRAHQGRPGPWESTVWTLWDEALLDGDHPDRRAWNALGVRRLVLTSLEPLAPEAIARGQRHLR